MCVYGIISLIEMTKIIDEPETENWSNIRLNVERSNCSLSFGTWALSSGLVGKTNITNNLLLFRNEN